MFRRRGPTSKGQLKEASNCRRQQGCITVERQKGVILTQYSIRKLLGHPVGSGLGMGECRVVKSLSEEQASCESPLGEPGGVARELASLREEAG